MIKIPDSIAVPRSPTLPHWAVPTPPRYPSDAPTANTGRTPNDQRSAEKIASHPLFASLKNYPKIIEDFKTQVGGDWNDSKLDPDTRANIAANAERVLIYMDSLGGAHSKANNHKIDGKNNGPTLPLPEKFRGPESEVALFSEAWRLLDFSKDGYSALLRPPLPPL
jgi:hypothetical protein